jgi:hypothetical protein
MWQAIRDHDWSEVDARLAPLFVGVNSAGQSLDHAGWIQYWKNGQLKDFALAEVVVQPNGSDMTVSYVVRLNNSHATSLRVLSVWQQLKRGWILTAMSITPLAPNVPSGSAK